MPPERARTLHGKPVTVTLFVAKPVFAAGGRTTIGADDHPDGAERVAYLKGRRYDVREGTRVTVTGTLRVIDHPGAFVGTTFVPPWTEIRVEDGK